MSGLALVKRDGVARGRREEVRVQGSGFRGGEAGGEEGEAGEARLANREYLSDDHDPLTLNSQPST